MWLSHVTIKSHDLSKKKCGHHSTESLGIGNSASIHLSALPPKLKPFFQLNHRALYTSSILSCTTSSLAQPHSVLSLTTACLQTCARKYLCNLQTLKYCGFLFGAKRAMHMIWWYAHHIRNCDFCNITHVIVQIIIPSLKKKIERTSPSSFSHLMGGKSILKSKNYIIKQVWGA